MTKHDPRFTTILVGVSLLTQASWAGQVAPDDVRRAVETWTQHVTADARPDAVIERLEPWREKSEIVAYIAHLAGGGFCICGADDQLLPVYLFVPKGKFDVASPSMRFVLDEIAARQAAIRDASQRGMPDPNLTAQLADRAAYWQDLIAGQAPALRTPPSLVQLPMTSLWNQSSPYNDSCPQLSPGMDEHTVTGCVATASAQVMYYWQWPSTGQGQTSMDYPIYFRTGWDSEPLASDPHIPSVYPWYPGRLRYDTPTHTLQINGYWDDSVHNAAVNLAPSNAAYQTALAALFNRIGIITATQFANHGATNYNFPAMRDSVDEPPDAASDAIALLSYHAGVACLMHWGILGSNTGNSEKIHALRDNFRYDPDIVGGSIDANVITTEIQWSRPVTMGGVDPNAGGHDWVVVGYNTATDPNRQFKMNFGWGGAENGWYTLDAVNTGNGAFNMNQYQVTRIAPINAVRFVDTVGSGTGKPSAPYGSLTQALADVPNNTTLVFKAGSTNFLSGGLLARPMTLKGFGVTILRQ